MQIEETAFSSDGLRLGADFYWPDDLDAPHPRPIVVACSGFTGLRHIHPERFARALTVRGHACFGFDYRGFADSEGERCRVLLEEQVRDVMHAVAFVAGDDRVDASRIVLLGWGMGAGIVLDAARALPGIVGIVGANGFYDGPRVQLAHRGEDGDRRVPDWIDEHPRARVRTGTSETADPFEIYPLDPQSRAYVDDVLRKTPGYEAERYSVELADSLLRWSPEAYAGEMSIPLLIAHGDRNLLHPLAEAESLHRAYAGPKELFLLEGAGHTEFMHDEDPRFRTLAARIGDWIDARLAETA